MNSTEGAAVSNVPMPRNISIKNLMDPDADFVFGFWLNGIGAILIGIIGIFGNIASIRVLSHKQMRSSFNFILIALAYSDLILIITSMLLFGLNTFYPYNGTLQDYYCIIHPSIAKITYPIAIIAQTISIYLTILISFERYIAVVHPLKAKQFCTHKRTKVFIYTVIFLSIFYNIPKFFEIVLLESIDSEYGKFYFLSASVLRVNKLYIKIYIHWLYFIFMNVIPLLGITFFNITIYRQVRIVNKVRMKLTCKNYENDIKLTPLIFCVVIVFLSCNFLAVLTNILESFYNIHNDRLTKLSNFFVTLNSSANFVIYVVLVKKFRLIFVRQLRSCFGCPEKRDRNSFSRATIRHTRISTSDSDPSSTKVSFVSK